SSAPWEGCVVNWTNSAPGTQIDAIVFTPPWNTFHLGDGISIFGTPIGRPLICDSAWLRFSGEKIHFEGYVVLAMHGLEAVAYHPVLNSDMVVDSVTFYPYPSRPPKINSSTNPYWHGFGTYLGTCEID